MPGLAFGACIELFQPAVMKVRKVCGFVSKFLAFERRVVRSQIRESATGVERITMSYALVAVTIMAIIVTGAIAFMWRKRALNTRSFALVGTASVGALALSAASVAAIAYLVWIALFIWIPPISNNQHLPLYSLVILLGGVCTIGCLLGGIFRRAEPEGKWLVATGLVLGALWLTAAAVSMPVS